MEQLMNYSTKEVDITKACGILCDYTDTLIKNCEVIRKNDINIGNISNLNVFLSGITGVIGGFMISHLLSNNNRVYCLIRGNKQLTAKERFIEHCEFYGVSKYISKQMFYINGDYDWKKEKFGISDFNWDFLCKNIDVVFNIGCRTTLNMSWEKGVKGIIHCSNTMIELSRTYKIKPILVIASCAMDCVSFGVTNGHKDSGFCRGYALSKWVDNERFIHLNHKYNHPIKLIKIGYIDAHEIEPPSFTYAAETLWYTCFKILKFPNVEWLIDYANGNVCCQKIIENINFADGKVFMGGYTSEIENQLSSLHIHKLMSQIEPNIKLVSPTEWNETAKEWIKNNYNQKCYQNIAYAADLFSVNGFTHLQYMFPKFQLPLNNMDGIPSIDQNVFVKILNRIHKQQEFVSGTNYKQKYGYKWWEMDLIQTSKL